MREPLSTDSGNVLRMQDASSLHHWFRFEPGTDTALAFASVPLMWAVFWTNARYGTEDPLVFVLVFMLFGNLGLNVLGPAWYVLRVRGEPLSELGMTLDRWWLSLAISLGTAAWSHGELMRVAASAGLEGDALLAHIVFNGLVFWEVFFVFGWLQLRFERAFGIAPGIVLAALGFAAYHLGTFPFDGVVGLAGFGLVFGCLFRVTRSVLALIPFAWAMTSGIGTIQGGFIANWPAVGAYIIVVAIQLGGIAWFARRRSGA